MAKIVIFSDLHAHGFKPYATVLPNGLNSRLADAVSCIRQVREHAVKIGADLVLFGGDMFHVRRNIAVQTFNAVYEEMARFVVDHIPVTMIHGNHDQADRSGSSFSIYAFSHFLHVVDKPGWVRARGASGKAYAILAIPFIESAQVVRELTVTTPPADVLDVPRIALAHLGVQGAVVGADFVYVNPHDPTVEDLHPNRFDAVFLGHYHKHQQLASNAWYVGAPLHHNWGDKMDPARGFLVYDTETRTIERVQVKAPEFVELDAGYDEPDVGVDGYVRVIAASDEAARSLQPQRQAMREKIGARSLEIVGPRGAVSPVVARIQLDQSTDNIDMLRRYVAYQRRTQGADDSLDDEYLHQLGAELLEEAEEV